MTSGRDGVGAVREAMERYVDATFRADVAAVQSTLHPEASMSGWLGNELLVGTFEPLFLGLGSRPPMAETGAPYKAEISFIVSSIEVSGRRDADRILVLRGHEFRQLLHLAARVRQVEDHEQDLRLAVISAARRTTQ